MLRAVVITLLGSLAACTSTGPTSTPTTDPNETDPVVTAEPTATEADPPATANAMPTSTSTAGGNDGREMTATECKVLAGKYGDVTRSDETKKLAEKLTDAQRSTAMKNIDEYANKLSSKWEGGCVSDLVGKVASEQSLKCAMAAKTVAAFDTCINGGTPQ
jgi:hypothetical protein